MNYIYSIYIHYMCVVVINNILYLYYNIITYRMLPVTCYLIGLGTSINFFIEVLGRAFNILLGKKVCFEL